MGGRDNQHYQKNVRNNEILYDGEWRFIHKVVR